MSEWQPQLGGGAERPELQSIQMGLKASLTGTTFFASLPFGLVVSHKIDNCPYIVPRREPEINARTASSPLQTLSVHQHG
jgi:hypothetical protein